MRTALFAPLLLATALAHAQAPATGVTLTVEPRTVYLEQLAEGTAINLDLVLTNHEAVALDIDRLQVTAFDAAGHVLLRRFVDGNGVRPSTAVLSNRRAEPNETVSVFQPFPPMPSELPVTRLRYELDLSGPSGTPSLTRSVEVTPVPYRNGSAFLLPLRGRMINYDGHDGLGHHRRFDTHFAPMAALGLTSNFMRYSYDFVPVNDAGEMRRGDAADNASWFGFGNNIHAVADGTVVLVRDGAPDDRHFDQSKIGSDPMVLFGNVVVVDHGHGEFGLYAHAKQGSAAVSIGQKIRRGAILAKVGASGSAFFPHLHLELQDGPDTRAEGLPSYFDGFARVVGDRLIARTQATVDTGEIVETLTP